MDSIPDMFTVWQEDTQALNKLWHKQNGVPFSSRHPTTLYKD